MAGHDILISTMGLAVMAGILWRTKVLKESNFTARFPDFVIAIYLIAQGSFSVYQSLDLIILNDQNFPSLILLLLPAAISISYGNTKGKMLPSPWLWFLVALAVVAYSTVLGLRWNIPEIRIVSPSFFAALFLSISMFFFVGFPRFLLGLAAVTWVIKFAGLASLGSSGVGIFMGAVVFSASLHFVNRFGSPGTLEFELNDFIKSITDALLILDLSGKVVCANDKFLQLGGYERGDILSSEAIDFFAIPSDWRFKFISSEKSKQVRCHLLSGGGEKIPVLLRLNEICNSRSQLVNLLCVISEEREFETLENRVKEETARFASLYETSAALSSSLEMKDVLRAIANAAEKLTKSDNCTIFSLDHARQILKSVYSTEEIFNSEVMNFELPVGKGLTGTVVSDAKPRIQNFDDEASVAVQVPGTSESEESLLCTPLIAKDVVIGALTMYKVGHQRFVDEDLKVLAVFASQASAIIETSRLYMKLKSSERLYRYSVDLAGDAIFFVDCETGKISDVNDMAPRLFKYSKAEFLAMHIWELNSDSQMHVTKRLWEEAKRTGWGRLGEVQHITRDGVSFPASVNVSIIYTGDLNFIQWMVRDISEFKRSLDKIGLFHQIFEKLAEPILITNLKGRILYANKSFCGLFMLDPENLEKGDVAAPNLQNSRLNVLTECWEKLKGKSSLIDEIAIVPRQNIELRKTVSILPHTDDHGEPKYFVWFFHSPLETALPDRSLQAEVS